MSIPPLKFFIQFGNLLLTCWVLLSIMEPYYERRKFPCGLKI
nr:MAG TPA: hypothetical protein [Bacteriophage sp.]